MRENVDLGKGRYLALFFHTEDDRYSARLLDQCPGPTFVTSHCYFGQEEASRLESEGRCQPNMRTAAMLNLPPIRFVIEGSIILVFHGEELFATMNANPMLCGWRRMMNARSEHFHRLVEAEKRRTLATKPPQN